MEMASGSSLLRTLAIIILSYYLFKFLLRIFAPIIMQKAVQTLKSKGVSISQEEEDALYVAILLHDIGHGPFSHAMEHSIVEEVHHEELSLLFMEELK
jgi:CRISPR/Cas system-associated endonuclease Cas3-HD